MTTSDKHLQLKAMLQGAGLKVSLVRLKILEVLQRNEQGVRSRELHDCLLLADEQISVLSVRQVLSRLCACGLVERDGDGLYRLLRARLQTAPVALAG